MKKAKENVQDGILRFQAIPIAPILLYPSLKHPSGKRYPGIRFAIEINRNQFKSDSNLVDFVNQNPVHIMMCDQKRETSSKFSTVLGKCIIDTRTSGDDKIDFFRLPIIAWKRDIKKIDNLHDLLSEEFIYVEIEKLQKGLEEFAPVQPKKKKPRDKNQRKLEMGDDE